MDERDLDLSAFIGPGDFIVCPQNLGEPVALTRRLVEQRHEIGPCSLFIGGSYSGVFRPEHGDRIRFLSYCGIGDNRALIEAGCLDLLPLHYSELTAFLERGRAPDVVLVQLSPADGNGRHSLGVSNDYILAAARRAKRIIAEINECMPWCHGAEWPKELVLDAAVHTRREFTRPKVAEANEAAGRIAQHVAAFIPDGSVIELGTGAIPDQILRALRHHKDLGIHTGLVGDALVDLYESGAVTNARKPIDTGVTVTALLGGSSRLERFAHLNPDLSVRPSSYTHDPAILAKLDGLIAINGAVEVDLTGQVSAEVAGPRYLGAVGGHGDFTRGALRAPNGRSIVALNATARQGRASTIVPRIIHGPVTTPRSDVDLVATEWGIAELRDQPVAERARRMVAIAHPDHREALEQSAAEVLKAGW
ncbi:acetyl-CoA hydrolase [Rhodoligotrophos appendicifer]|uniref:acetyl-CoA hydrolase/transferase family protein n=1 Tax=Rhodoligotrophos appendicifer TaxID=987056 RepID=UPI00117D73B8|nr:acetyl-CoA hydrolase/transferase C-terminal domain-containing protein [Rhodoligotrophos appendicifer]